MIVPIRNEFIKDIDHDDVNNTVHKVTDENCYIISAPINDLYELSQLVSKFKSIKLYVKSVSYAGIDTSYSDEDGDQFNDITTIPCDNYTLIGTISRDENKTWKFRIESGIPTKYIDIDLYVRCWSCTKNNIIRDFINDIYLRINKLGIYQPEGNTKLVDRDVIHPEAILTNESASVSTDDDKVTYTMEFNPNDVIVYLHDYLNNYLNEDDSDDDQIKQFIESIFDVDDCKLVKVSESLSRIIVDVAASYLLGVGTKAILNRAGIKSITRNPNTEKYIDNIKNRETGHRVKSNYTYQSRRDNK